MKDLTTFSCANPECRMTLLDLKPVDLIRNPPHVGDVLICGGCGLASKVSLTGTELMTDEDFLAMDKEERRDIEFAIRAIKRNLRAEQKGDFFEDSLDN